MNHLFDMERPIDSCYVEFLEENRSSQREFQHFYCDKLYITHEILEEHFFSWLAS